MCLAMNDWGIDVKYHHHEVGGCGQMEIEVELGDMLKLADDTMSAKYVIKNEAVLNGCTATFMPKPLAGEAGNGMHVHMHLFKDGKPVFCLAPARLRRPQHKSLDKFIQAPRTWL